MATRASCRAAACCLALFWLLHCVDTNSCSVDVNTDLAAKQPVLVVDGELAAPSGNFTATISFSAAVTVACSGSRNWLVGLGRREVEVWCSRGSTVTLAGRSVPFKELACSSKLSATLQVEDTSCGGGAGRQVLLGFQVGGRLHDTATACYDAERVSTLFSEHVLRGSGIGGRQLAQGTPGFEAGSLNRGFPFARLYRQASVSSTLTQLLGSKTLADRYTSQTFISRGHLAPRADFILQVVQWVQRNLGEASLVTYLRIFQRKAYQNSTFFYANVAPMWQSVNRGNWLRVEDAVRKLAQRRGVDLHVLTGTYGVLSLPNQQGRLREVYLHHDGQLPVPKFLWKVVHDSRAKSAVAFVTVNNPFLQAAPDDDVLCDDVCRRYGWHFRSRTTLTLGYTYCCDVRELRQIVSYVPAFKVNTVLRNN